MLSQHKENLPLHYPHQTTDAQLPKSGLLSLPTEVVYFILNHLEKADLKIARLACKALSPFIDPTLFREVVVVPHYGSLAALLQLAQHPTLNKHVQKVVVDNRWGIIRRPNQTGDIPEGRQDFFRDAVRGDPDVEVAYLSRAFRMLPALSNLRFRAAETSRARILASKEMPSYYLRYLEKLGPGEEKDISSIGGLKREIAPIAAWLAAFSAGICLRTVQADGLRNSYMFAQNGRFESIRLAFRSLQHLQLSFSIPQYGGDRGDVDGLRYIFTELPALESLDLSAVGIPKSPDYRPLFDAYVHLGSMIGMPSHFPRLVRLSLQGFYAYRTQLTDLLEINAASLESLRLANIILIKFVRENEISGVLGALPCWVEVIHGLQSKLKLKHMEFDVYLSNGIEQKWVIGNDNDMGPDNLKRRVEDFVINGGECPLDRCAVNKKDEIAEKDSGLPAGGDLSWYDDEQFSSSDEEYDEDGEDDGDEDGEDDDDEDGEDDEGDEDEYEGW
jgi:hypothetical protein